MFTITIPQIRNFLYDAFKFAMVVTTLASIGILGDAKPIEENLTINTSFDLKVS